MGNNDKTREVQQAPSTATTVTTRLTPQTNNPKPTTKSTANLPAQPKTVNSQRLDFISYNSKTLGKGSFKTVGSRKSSWSSKSLVAEPSRVDRSTATQQGGWPQYQVPRYYTPRQQEQKQQIPAQQVTKSQQQVQFIPLQQYPYPPNQLLYSSRFVAGIDNESCTCCICSFPSWVVWIIVALVSYRFHNHISCGYQLSQASLTNLFIPIFSNIRS